MSDTQNPAPAPAKTKWLVRSKTILGALVMAAPTLGELVFGVSVTPEQAQAIGGAAGDVLGAVNELCLVLGGALVAWGRMDAKTKTTLLPKLGSGTSKAGSPALAALAALGLTLLLAGCASPFDELQDMRGGLIKMGASEAPTEPDLNASMQRRLGDEVLGVAVDPEVRRARMYLATAAYFYIATDRVARYDPDDALVVLGRFEQLRGALARLDDANDAVFIETRLRESLVELAAVLVDTGFERAVRLAGNVATPGLGLARRGRVAVRQTLFTEALLVDIRTGVAEMARGGLEPAVARDSALALMDDAEGRVRALTGARPLAFRRTEAPRPPGPFAAGEGQASGTAATVVEGRAGPLLLRPRYATGAGAAAGGAQ